MILKLYQKLDDAISYLSGNSINEKKFLKEYFKKKKIFYVDIGTNEGSYLEFVSKTLNISKAFCFEPSKNLFLQLKNNYKNKYKFENYAVSDKNAIKKFYEYKISSQSSLYKQNKTFSSLESVNQIYNVKTLSLDNYFFKKRISIDFCKIDTQGEEKKILIGMQKLLKKKKIKLLKIELQFKELYKNCGSNYLDIINYLKSINYDLITFTKPKFKNNKVLFLDAFFEIKK